MESTLTVRVYCIQEHTANDAQSIENNTECDNHDNDNDVNDKIKRTIMATVVNNDTRRIVIEAARHNLRMDTLLAFSWFL